MKKKIIFKKPEMGVTVEGVEVMILKGKYPVLKSKDKYGNISLLLCESVDSIHHIYGGLLVSGCLSPSLEEAIGEYSDRDTRTWYLAHNEQKLISLKEGEVYFRDIPKGSFIEYNSDKYLLSDVSNHSITAIDQYGMICPIPTDENPIYLIKG